MGIAASQKDYTTELLGLEDARTEKAEEEVKTRIVTLFLLRKSHACPTFRDIARAFFSQAKIVIDRFHVTRSCAWAMDDVRRRV